MSEYLALEHMSKVTSNDLNLPKVTYYLPHHSILKKKRTTTKLRNVFDGSFPSDSGISLNNIQCIGPKIHRIFINRPQISSTYNCSLCCILNFVTVKEYSGNLFQIRDFWIYSTYGIVLASIYPIRSIKQWAIEFHGEISNRI